MSEATIHDIDELGRPRTPTPRSPSSGTRYVADRDSRAPRPADPPLRAAGEVRRRPGRQRPAGARGAGRPDLLRHLRADRRDHPLRAHPRGEVRELRHGAHPRRDHRRAAQHRLDPAVGAHEGPRSSSGPSPSSRRKLQRTPTDEEVADAMDMDVEDVRKFLGQLSLVNVVALDELLTDDDGGSSPAPGRHAQGHQRPRPAGDGRARRGPPAAGPGRRAAARAGEGRGQPLLLRGPDPGRHRPGARA